jgi:hemoglobin
MHLNRLRAMKASEHVVLARAQKMQEALALGIDEVFISQLVDHFYGAIQKDALLGPIFAKKISDWPHHLSRMKDFWASIMIESGRYSGNPMRKHIAIGGLDTAHFTRWHALWDQALTEVAPNPQASDKFRDAAGRIGESLLTGIEIDRGGLYSLSTKAVRSSRQSPRNQT